jgi:hypothetical protein
MINCPINLYSRQEEKIQRLTESINNAKSAAQKLPYAEALIEEVEVLLSCESFSEQNSNCQYCQNIAKLRKKTANLVIKAGRIEKRRNV